jgi:hypothetical protein
MMVLQYRATLRDNTVLLMPIAPRYGDTWLHTPMTHCLSHWPIVSSVYDTFNCQQDKVRDQECTCKELKTGTLQYFLHSSPHTINWQVINDSTQRLYVSVKNVSQSYTPNTLRLSHQLTRMQGSLLGYENKIYCNTAKVECVLQCILWVFWLHYPWK